MRPKRPGRRALPHPTADPRLDQNLRALLLQEGAVPDGALLDLALSKEALATLDDVLLEGVSHIELGPGLMLEEVEPAGPLDPDAVLPVRARLEIGSECRDLGAQGSTVLPDYEHVHHCAVTLTGNAVHLSNPLNTRENGGYYLFVRQDSEGGRRITSFGNKWLASGGSVGFSTEPGAVDLFYFVRFEDHFYLSQLTHFLPPTAAEE
jgi:hypothetical protein